MIQNLQKNWSMSDIDALLGSEDSSSKDSVNVTLLLFRKGLSKTENISAKPDEDKKFNKYKNA